MFLGKLRLRGAAQLMIEGRKLMFLGELLPLLDGMREEAVCGGAPAARGCSIEGGRGYYFWGSSRRAGGAAHQVMMKGGTCLWGSSRCTGLLNRGGRRILFLGKLLPRGRGCSSSDDEGRNLFVGELPPPDREGGSCFWGSSRCAGAGCSNDDEGRNKLFLGDKLLSYCADGCSMSGGRRLFE